MQAVRAGCDVNAADHWGLRPVHYASQLVPVNILRRLLRYNVDPNALTTAGNKCDVEHAKHGQWSRADLSPLMVAASHGHADAIRMLLKNGAKATLTNSRGETALHFAAAAPVYAEECIIALVGQQSGTGRSPVNLLNVQVSSQHIHTQRETVLTVILPDELGLASCAVAIDFIILIYYYIIYPVRPGLR